MLVFVKTHNRTQEVLQVEKYDDAKHGQFYNGVGGLYLLNTHTWLIQHQYHMVNTDELIVNDSNLTRYGLSIVRCAVEFARDNKINSIIC